MEEKYLKVKKMIKFNYEKLNIFLENGSYIFKHKYIPQKNKYDERILIFFIKDRKNVILGKIIIRADQDGEVYFNTTIFKNSNYECQDIYSHNDYERFNIFDDIYNNLS